MARTILLVFLILPAILISYVSGACFHVETRDLLEYSCTGGYITDLNSIPEGVERLKISRMRIPIITPHTFSRFSENLLVLKCSECDITDIEPNSFSSLAYLQQLSLDNNRLTSIKASWLEGLRDLNYLDLTYNQIENIEDEAFEYLTEVTDLRLSGNRLKCLNLDAMSRMANLKRIFLNDNPNFQCPNAVTKFLQDRNVTFQEDDTWRTMTQDLVQASRGNQQDWRTKSYFYPTTTIPAYRERLTDTRRPPTTEIPWSTYPQWPTTTESDIARQDIFLSRGSSDYTKQYTQQTYTPPMDRNWMTTQPSRPYWSSDRTTVYVPRSRPVETTYPTEDMSRPMIPAMPIETVHTARPKGVHQQSGYVPQVTDLKEVENYRQFEETRTVSGPVKAETDKPLPDCPNSSSAISAVMQVTLLSVLLSFSKIVLGDGL